MSNPEVVIVVVLNICRRVQKWLFRAKESLQSKGPMTLGFVQGISNARALAFKQQAIVSGSANNAANDRSEEGDHEIVVSR